LPVISVNKTVVRFYPHINSVRQNFRTCLGKACVIWHNRLHLLRTLFRY